jgi:hypothetical protein
VRERAKSHKRSLEEFGAEEALQKRGVEFIRLLLIQGTKGRERYFGIDKI